MFLAKIKGNLVSTQKNKELIGHKLQIIHPIDLEGNFIGEKDSVAIDLVDAGVGDTVLALKEGAAVQQILGHKRAPVNTMIVAVVDDIDVQQ
jgi:ethanolamine utilization protein EutN